MMQAQKSGKINWLLILQGWAMLWVVIGHGPLETPHSEQSPLWCDFLYDTAYSFHMPLFIFVSGFLFYLTRISKPGWKYISMLLEKLKRFGIPFIVFTIVGICIKTAFSSFMVHPAELSIEEFLKAIIYPGEGPMREFWFLATIMWYFIMFPLWRLILNKKILSIVFIVVCVALHFSHPGTTLLAADTSCTYLVYFFSGLLVGKAYQQYGIKSDVIKTGTILLIMSVTLFVYILSRFFRVELLEAVCGILFSSLLALLLDRYFMTIFHSFRNYTYQIFLMGIFAQVLVRIVYSRFGLPYLPMYILSVAAGIYVPVLVSKLISRQPFEFLKLCIGIN